MKIRLFSFLLLCATLLCSCGTASNEQATNANLVTWQSDYHHISFEYDSTKYIPSETNVGGGLQEIFGLNGRNDSSNIDIAIGVILSPTKYPLDASVFQASDEILNEMRKNMKAEMLSGYEELIKQFNMTLTFGSLCKKIYVNDSVPTLRSDFEMRMDLSILGDEFAKMEFQYICYQFFNAGEMQQIAITMPKMEAEESAALEMEILKGLRLLPYQE